LRASAPPTVHTVDEATAEKLGLPRGGVLLRPDGRDYRLPGRQAKERLGQSARLRAPDVPASLVKEGGRVASPTGAAGEGPGRTLVMAAPTPENLDRLARLLADGTLKLHIQDTYELAQAPDALTALATTHTQGKLAIRVAAVL
jgi:hypothetical protein